MKTPLPTKVLVVEDELVIAESLRRGLTALGYVVPSLAATAAAAIEQAETARPDIVLMDIRLKGSMDGIEAAERILERMDIPIVFLTAYGDDATLDRVKRLRPGAYLLKPFREQDVRVAIETALYRHQFERTIASADEPEAGKRDGGPTGSKLTPRERQVLRLVATGLTNKEIGGVLAISTRTVESHRENIMAKLHVHSTAELVRYAIHHGILPP